MFLSNHRVHNKGVEHIQVASARGNDTLFIDGNLDGYGVVFPHEVHKAKNGGSQGRLLVAARHVFQRRLRCCRKSTSSF